jgi:hypothetical protein
MAAPSARVASPWLHGAFSDLTFGTGLIYLPLFLILLFGGGIMQTVLPIGFVPLVILAFSIPHLGATLLRVYERREDRRAYAFFSIYCTIAIAGSFAIGLYWPPMGSVLITLYLTVVPWHFTGQNYGVGLIFLRRRGIDVSADVKRFIYMSFVTTYGMTLLALHGKVLSGSYAPLETKGTVYGFLALGIPPKVQVAGIMILFALYVWSLFESVVRLRGKGASWSDLAPFGGVVLTQSLWYAVPIGVRLFVPPQMLGAFDPANHGYMFVWVAQVHSIQYLWVTSYYVKKQNPKEGLSRHLVKALLAGSAIYGIPLLLLTPGVLGRIPYDAGLYLMLAGALNVHHVLMDSAIWKLRNGRIAKILLRSGEAEPSAEEPSTGGWAWVRPVVYLSGAIGAGLMIAGTLEEEMGVARAGTRGDLPRVEQAEQRLTWMGRESARVNALLGTMRAENGDPKGALQALNESNELQPNALAWTNIGVIRRQLKQGRQALAAFEEAVKIEPDNVTALFYAGDTALALGQPERARPYLEHAAELDPERQDIQRSLRRVRKASKS